MSEKGCQTNANYNILECNRLHTNQIIHGNIQTIDLSTNIHNHIINNNSQFINLMGNLNNHKTITLPRPTIGNKIRIVFSEDIQLANHQLRIILNNGTTVSGSYIEHIITPGAIAPNVVNFNTFSNIHNRGAAYINAPNEIELNTGVGVDPTYAGSYLEFICLRDNNYTMNGNIIIS